MHHNLESINENGRKLLQQKCALVVWTVSVVTIVFILTTFRQRQNEEPFSVSYLKHQSMVWADSSKENGDKAGMSMCEIGFESTFHIFTSEYRRCLLEKLANKSKWTDLKGAIDSCLGETWWKIFHVQMLSNWDDVKLVILPWLDSLEWNSTRNQSQFDCVEVTLGVGKDIEAEKKLRNLLPNCRFYGADPIRSSGEVFKEMGQYYEVAVASKAGLLQASVLENGYRNKVVPTVTLVDFVQNYTKVDHIDYLFMDNEGAEYGLFEQLQPGGAIDSSNMSICQISVEMHGPLENYGMNQAKYDQLIESTIAKTSFLPFWSTYPSNHIRSFYLNVKDKYCLKMFYSSKFC